MLRALCTWWRCTPRPVDEALQTLRWICKAVPLSFWALHGVTSAVSVHEALPISCARWMRQCGFHRLGPDGRYSALQDKFRIVKKVAAIAVLVTAVVVAFLSIPRINDANFTTRCLQSGLPKHQARGQEVLNDPAAFQPFGRQHQGRQPPWVEGADATTMQQLARAEQASTDCELRGLYDESSIWTVCSKAGTEAIPRSTAAIA